MSILLFILILLVLVLIHEAGHFIVAKIARIRVDEFAFGFPPRIFGIKKGETTYALNLFPIGGYVKIFGENPEDVAEGSADRARSFIAKPRFVQGLVVIAGVVMNWLLAWLLIWITLMLGVGASLYDLPAGKTLDTPELLVMEVMHDSPAEKAGILAGDRVLALSGSGSALPISELLSIGGFSRYVGEHATDTLRLIVKGAEGEREVAVTPVLGLNPRSATTSAIGVMLDISGTVRFGFVEAGKESFVRTWNYTVLTAKGLGDFFMSIIHGSANLGEVTGPVGIVKVVGEASAIGIVPVLLLSALISINLSLINLLPFPALDGGRLLFIVLEGVLRRPISARFQSRVNTVGFLLLLCLMVVITYHDIAKL